MVVYSIRDRQNPNMYNSNSQSVSCKTLDQGHVFNILSQRPLKRETMSIPCDAQKHPNSPLRRRKRDREKQVVAPSRWRKLRLPQWTLHHDVLTTPDRPWTRRLCLRLLSASPFTITLHWRTLPVNMMHASLLWYSLAVFVSLTRYMT